MLTACESAFNELAFPKLMQVDGPCTSDSYFDKICPYGSAGWGSKPLVVAVICDTSLAGYEIRKHDIDIRGRNW